MPARPRSPSWWNGPTWRALLGQLGDALLELLALHAIQGTHAGAVLRREDRDVLVVELGAGGQRVAQLVDAGIEQADDVARPGFLDGFAGVRHELLGLLDVGFWNGYNPNSGRTETKCSMISAWIDS